MIIWITASLSSKKYNMALAPECIMHCVGRNVVNVRWNDFGVLDWKGVMHV